MVLQIWAEANEDGSLLETLYKTLDEVKKSKTFLYPWFHEPQYWSFCEIQVINLAECEVYSYDPNSDADPFIEKGAL